MIDNQRTNWPGWETVKLIGRGSFGAVYEIQRDVFGDTEKSALKVLSIPQNESDIEELYSDGYDDESITSTFQEHLRSIVEEYSLMRKLNGCANVVHCDDIRYVQHDDGFGWDIFIKMELLTPLMKVSASQSAEEMAIKVGKDICNALIACKEYGIVHRDIKPQNIFVSKYGDYKLGDFGIAKTVEKTMGGTKIGTYKYMAPEVYNNQPYGSAADIYSLGLVLYWLLNERRMPFLPLPPEKLSANMEEKARNRRFAGEQIPAPAHGSESLKKIVLKACAYDPKDRYATAAEMLRDLKEGFGAFDVQCREEERRKMEEAERLRLQKEAEERERVRKIREEQERLRKEVEKQARLQHEREERERICRDAAERNYAGQTSRETEEQNCLDKDYDCKQEIQRKETEAVERKQRPSPRKKLIVWAAALSVVLGLALTFLCKPGIIEKGQTQKGSLGDFGVTEETSTKETESVSDVPVRAEIPNEAIYYNGHYYYMYRESSVSVETEAVAFCESKGGYLAIAETEEEQQVLRYYMQSKNCGNALFGLADNGSANQWNGIGNANNAFLCEWEKEKPVATENVIIPVIEKGETYRHPLTGMVCDAPYVGRATAFNVDNVSKALPQYGVSQADLVCEIRIDGGATRTLALFTDMTSVSAIGPLRGAREQLVSLADAFGAVFVHVGGQDYVRSLYDSASIDYVDNDGRAIYKDQKRLNSGYAREYCYFANGEKMWACVTGKFDMELPVGSWGFNFVPYQTIIGEDAENITIHFGETMVKTTSFQYDQDLNGYAVSQFGEDYIDGNTGKQLVFNNVLVIKEVPNANGENRIIGQNTGWYLCDGKILPIQWSRSNEKDSFSFTLEDGTALTMIPGKTYLAIISDDGKIVL